MEWSIEARSKRVEKGIYNFAVAPCDPCRSGSLRVLDSGEWVVFHSGKQLEGETRALLEHGLSVLPRVCRRRQAVAIARTRRERERESVRATAIRFGRATRERQVSSKVSIVRIKGGSRLARRSETKTRHTLYIWRDEFRVRQRVRKVARRRPGSDEREHGAASAAGRRPRLDGRDAARRRSLRPRD